MPDPAMEIPSNVMVIRSPRGGANSAVTIVERSDEHLLAQCGFGELHHFFSEVDVVTGASTGSAEVTVSARAEVGSPFAIARLSSSSNRRAVQETQGLRCLRCCARGR